MPLCHGTRRQNQDLQITRIAREKRARTTPGSLFITGADSGIGQANAVEFARNGTKVVINYLEVRQGAENTRAQVESAGAKAAVIQGDVGKSEDVERLFSTCEEQLGTATILVNNAGIDSTGKKVEDLSLDEWSRALQTNLTGPFLCAHRFITALKRAKGKGRIINISSVHEEIPRAGAAEYCPRFMPGSLFCARESDRIPP